MEDHCQATVRPATVCLYQRASPHLGAVQDNRRRQRPPTYSGLLLMGRQRFPEQTVVEVIKHPVYSQDISRKQHTSFETEYGRICRNTSFLWLTARSPASTDLLHEGNSRFSRGTACSSMAGVVVAIVVTVADVAFVVVRSFLIESFRELNPTRVDFGSSTITTMRTRGGATVAGTYTSIYARIYV